MGGGDGIKAREKKCDDLWNQDSEREWGFRGEEWLCGRGGLHWEWMEKKKRVDLRERGGIPGRENGERKSIRVEMK